MTRRTFAILLAPLAALFLTVNLSAAQQWRVATQQELNSWIPARAPVVKEQIETESRTETGIVEQRRKIHCGRSSHHIRILRQRQVFDLSRDAGSAEDRYRFMEPGQYMFGWQRVNDKLRGAIL